MNVPASAEHDPNAPSRPSRRAVLGLVLGAALGGAGVPAGLAAKPSPKRSGRRSARRRRQRKPRYRVVTRTFASTVPITIPDSGAADPYPATILVRGLRGGTILDLNVALSGLTHTQPDDLDVILAAPNGLTAVVLMSEVGGTADISQVSLGFDDQAGSFLPFDAQIVSGTFKPTLPGVAPRPEMAALRSFNGLNPNGTWRLSVADDNGGDRGSITGWSLTIKARIRI